MEKQIGHFLYFLGSLYYFKYHTHVYFINRINILGTLFRLVYFIIYPLPTDVFNVLVKKCSVNTTTNSLLVKRTKHKKCLKWQEISVKYCNLECKRLVQVLFLPNIPKNTILCSTTLLFNIKSKVKLFHWQDCPVELNVQDPESAFDPENADNITISSVKSFNEREVVELNNVIPLFLKENYFIYVSDVLPLDLEKWNPDQQGVIIYIKVVSVNGSSDIQSGFVLSEKTSVFQTDGSRSFIPSEVISFSNPNLRTVSPLLPFGFEHHFKGILHLFQPFFLNCIEGIDPLFVISGHSGIGKSLLLKCVAHRMGIHYASIDCNNFIGSSSIQIQANFKTIFSKLYQSSPSLVELYNVEVLLTDSESNDTEVIISCLNKSLHSYKMSPPNILVLTCTDLDSFPSSLLNLVLQEYRIELPSEAQRFKMFIWLLHHFSLTLNNEILTYINTETAGYTFTDLKRLLIISNRDMLKETQDCLSKDNFKSAFDKLNKIDKKTGNVDWEDVGGVEDIKKIVLSSVNSGKLGKFRRTGLLLHGPPGTGKTLLARAVASQCAVSFIPVKGPELLNMYVGQSEANIRQVFRKAHDASPCILFFDEIDSLAPNRGNKGDSGGVMDRVVTQLLSEMDGLAERDGIFILAATNRPDLIDSALLRPGRLDKMLYIGPCEDPVSKLKVLKAQTRKFEFVDGFNIEDILDFLPDKVTGAQVYALCYAAWITAAKQLICKGETAKGIKVQIKREHFDEALTEMKW